MATLKHITFTGVDSRTDISELLRIRDKYPLVEFGVLLSEKWAENGNRYFNPDDFYKLTKLGLRLSGHLCGSLARGTVKDGFNKLEEFCGGYLEIFQRVQLNIAPYRNIVDKISFDYVPQTLDEIIIQQRKPNDCELFMKSELPHYCSMLLDASGGRGIDTEVLTMKSDYKIGYAGGFNPENTAKKLEYLLNDENVGDFWIDMESGVRTDDWFDTKKVEQVLESINHLI